MMQEEGQSHGQGMYAYYLVHLWERLFLVPLWIVRMTKYKSIGALTEFLTSQSVSWVYCWDFSEWITYLGTGLSFQNSSSCFMIDLGVSHFPTWTSQFPQKYFYLWMDAKLLLLRGGYKQEHLIWPFYWCHSRFFCLKNC